tara:strand:+ start:977 stop:1165 length:189 start_codon:yes stop_codon:yes gene_type:complete
MCRPLEGVGISMAKKDLGAPEARKKWCNCVTEFGEMVSEEVKTNPRYNLKSHWSDRIDNVVE